MTSIIISFPFTFICQTFPVKHDTVVCQLSRQCILEEKKNYLQPDEILQIETKVKNVSTLFDSFVRKKVKRADLSYHLEVDTTNIPKKMTDQFYNWKKQLENGIFEDDYPFVDFPHDICETSTGLCLCTNSEEIRDLYTQKLSAFLPYSKIYESDER